MRGSYLPYLFGVVLASLSCDPGNYDLQSCDPTVLNLNQDACNVLNAGKTDCTSVYQCDYATKSCKLGPKDYDRDGDPDKACGGNDCNDSDRDISSLNMMCGCSRALLDQPCHVGDGACLANATYSCKDGGLFCTVPHTPPVSDPDYMTMPYMDKSGYTTWDWDCDAKTTMKCPDANGALSDCQINNCGPTKLNVNSTASEVDSSCKAYCTGLAVSACVDQRFVCSTTCGKPVYYCHCTVVPAMLLTPASCTGGASPASTTVRCK